MPSGQEGGFAHASSAVVARRRQVTLNDGRKLFAAALVGE
jgi:hypothetical protein